VLALAGLLALVVLSPMVQTWMVERMLARHPGLHATVESASLGLSTARVVNLQTERNGVILTAPLLEATLPVKTALWHRRFWVEKVVAKGWTLDLSHSSNTTQPPSVTPSAAPTARSGVEKTQSTSPLFQGVLAGLSLPSDTSVNEVDLEGDVLLAQDSNGQATFAHIILKGGPLAAGRTGDFTIDVAASAAALGQSSGALHTHGRLGVEITPPGAVNRIELKTELRSASGSAAFDVIGSAATTATAGNEVYRVELRREARSLAKVAANFQRENANLAGTWSVDLEDGDAGSLIPAAFAQVLAASGEGTFDSDVLFTHPHVAGKLKATGRAFGFLAAPPGGPNVATFEANFDLSRRGTSLRVDRLNLSIAAPKPAVVVDFVRPFEWDETTRQLTPADPRAEWVRISLRKLPLAWLPANAGFAFASGEVTGTIAVSGTGENGVVQSTGPLVATDVSAQKAGQIFAQGLDLSAAVRAEFTPKESWQVRVAPLTLDRDGHRLATVEANMSLRPDVYGRLPVSGTWSADLDTLATQNVIPGAFWITGQSASGNFSAKLGAAGDLIAKVKVIGHDPAHTVTANVSASITDFRSATFRIPVTIATNSTASEISVDGTWAAEKETQRIAIQVSAKKVALEHLRLALARVSSPQITHRGATAAPASHAEPRDQVPFWGHLVGQARFDFGQVDLGTYQLEDVSGSIVIDPSSFGLNGGRGVFNPLNEVQSIPKHHVADLEETKLEPRSILTLDGTVTFDRAGPVPYTLKATGALDEIDGARLFGASSTGHDPMIEGRFGVTFNASGGGVNLPDLLAHQHEEFRLTSTAGIIRFLKANVAQSLPDAPSRATDKLAGVGYAVGSLFGLKEKASATAHLGPGAEAILNLSYQFGEIGYDQLAATAIRGADDALQLEQIAISAPREYLSGSGRIAASENLPLRMRPLSLDLQLGFRGFEAEQLALAGLLPPSKDPLGYTKLPEPIHFGGTLDQIDNSAWRDLLVKAASRATEQSKKTR
jgi:hypothetical protein